MWRRRHIRGRGERLSWGERPSTAGRCGLTHLLTSTSTQLGILHYYIPHSNIPNGEKHWRSLHKLMAQWCIQKLGDLMGINVFELPNYSSSLIYLVGLKAQRDAFVFSFVIFRYWDCFQMMESVMIDLSQVCPGHLTRFVSPIYFFSAKLKTFSPLALDNHDRWPETAFALNGSRERRCWHGGLHEFWVGFLVFHGWIYMLFPVRRGQWLFSPQLLEQHCSAGELKGRSVLWYLRTNVH